MNLPLTTVLALFFGVLAYGAGVYSIDRSLQGSSRAIFRYLAVAGAIVGFCLGVRKYVESWSLAVDWCKGGVAAAAVAALFYEAYRAGVKRPIAERWKKFVGISLAAGAIAGYFNGGDFGNPWYHRWEFFHYYMGAKYFHELGYDGLYKCAVAAELDLGTITWQDPNTGRSFSADLAKEVRMPDKKIRNLGGNNLIIPATEAVEHPERCRELFTPPRWEAYQADVRFFRIVSDKGWWDDMQKDHGFNPPPAWTVLGKFFSELHPATATYLKFLASIDLILLAGMFTVLWWGFGWRVSAIAAIFWGCQSPAPHMWTFGAFLRQDWLFLMVLSVALMRKRWYKLSGAAMIYAGLLRIFPGLIVIGWLFVAGWALVRTRRMPKAHRDTLIGGVAGALVIIPLSLGVCGKDAYQQFYAHTIQVHGQTPLTNHMGLRTLIAHKAIDVQAAWPPIKLADGSSSGRMKYVEDGKLNDPFEVWKRMRLQRYAKYKWIGWIVIGATLGLFGLVTRRVKSLWVAQCLAQIFCILLAELTCYYYSFMILSAPLTKARRQLEIPLLGLALLSQPVFDIFGYNDDKYTALTYITLAFCYGVLVSFLPRSLWENLFARLARKPAPQPVVPGSS